MMNNNPVIPPDITVGVIGCGKMGEAILKGLIRSGSVAASNISASRRSSEQLSELKSNGVFCTSSNIAVAQRSRVIIIAVKGYMFDGVLSEIRKELSADKVIISVAAGVKIEKLEGMLPDGARVVRVMPNTPCLVGAGASCHSLGTHASKDDGLLVKALFSTIGICEEVPENLINAVIGVAGSGAAYMFMTLGSLADGGVKLGLPRDVAQKFANQAMFGAAKMAMETKIHPEVLKDNVCSPGGTTIAAVHCLEKHGVRNAFISAAETAANTATLLDNQKK